MKITTLMAAAVFGAGLAFVAPSAEAMPRGLAPVDVTETGNVQKVHGRHCKRIRGHRSRCKRVVRRTHRHQHCHHNGCHRHSHYNNHHHSNSYWRKRRPGFSIQLNF